MPFISYTLKCWLFSRFSISFSTLFLITYSEQFSIKLFDSFDNSSQLVFASLTRVNIQQLYLQFKPAWTILKPGILPSKTDRSGVGGWGYAVWPSIYILLYPGPDNSFKQLKYNLISVVNSLIFSFQNYNVIFLSSQSKL